MCFEMFVRGCFEVEGFVFEASGSCIAIRLSQKVLKRELSECVDKGRRKHDAESELK